MCEPSCFLWSLTSYSYSIHKHCIRGIGRYIAAFSLQYLFAELLPMNLFNSLLKVLVLSTTGSYGDSTLQKSTLDSKEVIYFLSFLTDFLVVSRSGLKLQNFEIWWITVQNSAYLPLLISSFLSYSSPLQTEEFQLCQYLLKSTPSLSSLQLPFFNCSVLRWRGWVHAVFKVWVHQGLI